MGIDNKSSKPSTGAPNAGMGSNKGTNSNRPQYGNPQQTQQKPGASTNNWGNNTPNRPNQGGQQTQPGQKPTGHGFNGDNKKQK